MSAETLIGVLLSMKDGLLRIGMKMVTMFSNIRERRRKDRMARDYFEEFKNTTFSFEKLFGSGHNSLVDFLEELDADGSHIQIIQSSLKGYGSLVIRVTQPDKSCIQRVPLEVKIYALEQMFDV